MTEPDANIGSLSNQSNEPLTVTIGGKTMGLKPLRLLDFAAAQRYLIERRLETFLDATKLRPLSDAVRAQALAGIMAEIPDLPTVLTSIEGKLYLIWRSARDGNNMPLKAFAAGLTDYDLSTLENIVMEISGLLTEEDDSPLAGTATQEDQSPQEQPISATA